MNPKRIYEIRHDRTRLKKIENKLDEWAKSHYLYFKIRHYRKSEDDPKDFTVVYILDDDGTIMSHGQSIVHPNDNFDRMVGRIIAKTRAKNNWHKSFRRK